MDIKLTRTQRSVNPWPPSRLFRRLVHFSLVAWGCISRVSNAFSYQNFPLQWPHDSFLLPSSNGDAIDRHDMCLWLSYQAPLTSKFCYLEAGSIMNIFPFIVLWNIPSIWTHLTAPPLRTITQPYPVIITGPEFLLPVRCRRMAMMQWLVMPWGMWFLVLTKGFLNLCCPRLQWYYSYWRDRPKVYSWLRLPEMKMKRLLWHSRYSWEIMLVLLIYGLYG